MHVSGSPLHQMHALSPRRVTVAFDAPIEHVNPSVVSGLVLELRSMTQNVHGSAPFGGPGDEACIQRNGRLSRRA
jgi:hypothetical protein